MITPDPSRNGRWRLWAALLLLAIFTALPGPWRSPFSGMPFSSKAYLIVAALLVIGLAIALFPPRLRIGTGWLIALVLLCVVKVGLFPLLRDEGWRGEYATAQIHMKPERHAGVLTPVPFYWRGVRNFRMDRLLTFNDVNFALLYVNDWPVADFETNVVPRHITQPLRVHWTGYVQASSAATFTTTVTANGSVAIALDGKETLRAVNPRDAAVSFVLSQGEHRIDVTYDKAAGEKPLFSLEPMPLPVTPFPTPPAELSRSHLATYAINLLGVIALLVFAGACATAYRPITGFLLEDIWRSPDRVALIAFVALALLAGVAGAIATRGATQPLPNGDDPVVYEAGARAVLFNGFLMKRSPTDTSPFFFYPLYSYALAGMHVLFGEDFGAIRFLNWVCVAVTAVLLWVLLRKRLNAGSLIVVLLGFAFFTREYLLRYLQTAFTDNLFLPICVATVLVSSIAFERRSYGWLFLTGVMTALGAATRPSLLIYMPFFVATLLLFWTGNIIRRGVAVTAYGAGFAAMLSPFTIRNWVVAHKLVPLMSSYVMLPYFLYGPGQTPDRPIGDGTVPGSIRAFFDILTYAPVRSLWLELRKVIFTLGYTPAFSGYRVDLSLLLILIPIAFFAAAKWKRIPRPMLIAILAFATSHLTAMVIAAPWTYGYKTILPFHLLLAVGAAFLLPRYGEAAARDVTIPRPLPGGRKSVSVVLPASNKNESIRQVILDFFATGAIDEVIVVNNNDALGTSEEVAGTGAREVFETRGYGWAVRRGMEEANGDYVVICEPDGTFLGRDTFKLLAYADDFDAVYGSRASRQFIWRNVSTWEPARIGNWIVAKWMELLYGAPTLTDAGCAMRLIRRDVIRSLAGQFRSDDRDINAEMIALTLQAGYQIVQIPVSYAGTAGSSTGNLMEALRRGARVLWLITRRRFETSWQERSDERPRSIAAESPSISL